MPVFQEQYFLRLFNPQLTTVEPPLFQMGKEAAELILEKIKNPLSPNRSIVLDAEIQLRASSMKKSS